MSPLEIINPLLLGLFLTIPCFVHGSLYGPTEPIAQLDPSTFSGTVLGSDQAWVVEFYADWCGYCQRLAPIYKQYAREIKGWNKVLRVAAVACSDSVSAPLCRQQNIWGYPTIKFYPAQAAADFRGHNYNGAKSLEGLIQASVEYIVTQQKDGVAPSAWPRVTPYSNKMELLRRHPTAINLFALTQAVKGTIAPKVVLDVSDLHPETVVGVIESTDLAQGQVELSVVHPNGNSAAIQSSVSRGDLASTIRTYVTHRPDPTTRPPVSTPRPTLRIPADAELMMEGLHSQDLESSLHYSLWLEVGGKPHISGPALVALKEHIRVMNKYHPGDAHIKTFLNRTHDWLQQQPGPITGEQWQHHITNLQDSVGYVPDRVQWTGCQGSEPHLRGYPCSLWMTFHALTVSACQAHGQDSDFNPDEVLVSMREYVRYFMGCRHCADNFCRHTTELEQEITEKEDGVLWLWNAHNIVNRILHGDPTEDMMHPKVQFPRHQACVQCRTRGADRDLFAHNTTWRDRNVLEYLLEFYGKDSIIRDALPYTYSRDAASDPSPEPCSAVTMPWSPCSQTCGIGVSSRLSNAHSPSCQVVMEFRLCFIRPCGSVSTPSQREYHGQNPVSTPRPQGDGTGKGFIVPIGANIWATIIHMTEGIRQAMEP